jgi:hypothetical protein
LQVNQPSSSAAIAAVKPAQSKAQTAMDENNLPMEFFMAIPCEKIRVAEK